MKLKLILLIIILSVFKSNNIVGQTNHDIESIKIGEIIIYKLKESEFYIPTKILQTINEESMPELAANLDSIHEPVNVFLIKTPKHNILIEAGLGIYNSSPNKLKRLLKEVSIEPSQIDMILITHFHYDQIGGLIDTLGNASFPNASLFVSKKENDYWFNNSDKLLKKHQSWSKKIPNFFAPYINANRYNTFKVNEIIADGIQAIPGYCHTMGHTIFSFKSGIQEWWCVADLLILKEIQFKHPKLSTTYDTNPEMAVESRKVILKQAAEKSVYIAASHNFDFFKIKNNGEKIVEIPVKTK